MRLCLLLGTVSVMDKFAARALKRGAEQAPTFAPHLPFSSLFFAPPPSGVLALQPLRPPLRTRFGPQNMARAQLFARISAIALGDPHLALRQKSARTTRGANSLPPVQGRSLASFSLQGLFGRKTLGKCDPDAPVAPKCDPDPVLAFSR